MSLPAAAERAATLRLLADLQRAVEDLLLTGLAAASQATRETLSAAFQSASRGRLLRLGATLRVATEEIGRFATNDPTFSRRRFAFFLGRAWLLSHGMGAALEQEDAERWDHLLGQPATRAVAAVEVVTLGVARRVVPGAFAAFEFRLRALESGGALPKAAPLVWSVVFPLKPGSDVPPEAFLHLPQPQGFTAALFLEGQVVRLSAVQISGEGRVSLAKDSRAEPVRAFDAWDTLLRWDPAAAAARAAGHKPGPFDLEIELQEEVVLHDVQVGTPAANEREHQLRYPVQAAEGTFQVVTGAGPEDAPLRERLGALSEKQPGPLFAVMHYEMGRLLLQPLTLFGAEGPQALQLREGTFDAASLVKALKFT